MNYRLDNWMHWNVTVLSLCCKIILQPFHSPSWWVHTHLTTSVLLRLVIWRMHSILVLHHLHHSVLLKCSSWATTLAALVELQWSASLPFPQSKVNPEFCLGGSNSTLHSARSASVEAFPPRGWKMDGCEADLRNCCRAAALWNWY